MREKHPVLEVFLGRDGEGSRLYFAKTSWCPPMVRDHLDEHAEVFLSDSPDLEDLDRHMWATDSPYEKRTTKTGGATFHACGRSAVTMAVWIDGLVLQRAGT